jgi:hypothetical protein
MLKLKEPSHVVVERERGMYFNSMPTDKDLSKMNKYENIYILVPVGTIVILFLFGVFVPALWGEGLINNLFFFSLMIFIFECIGLVLAIMIRIDRWKDKRKKMKGEDTGEIKLYDYVKVFPSVVIMYSYFWFDERTNIIYTSDVKAVHLDAPRFLEGKGVKLPFIYKPFRQKAPSPLKYDGSLYSNISPLDHLVRIELKKPLKIRSWNPDLKKFSFKLFREDTYRMVDNLIISIRPKDQERFKRTVEKLAG